MGFQTFSGGGTPDSDDDVIYNVRRVPADRLNFAFCLNYSGFSSRGAGGPGTTDEKFTGASLELLALPRSPCVQRLLLAERLATRACLTVDFFPA